VSVRNHAGESLSTAEIKLVQNFDSSLIPIAGQHRAIGNRNASPECSQALEGYLKLIQSEHGWELKELVEHNRMRRDSQQAKLDWRSSLIPSEIMRNVLANYNQAVSWMCGRLCEEQEADPLACDNRSKPNCGSIIAKTDAETARVIHIDEPVPLLIAPDW